MTARALTKNDPAPLFIGVLFILATAMSACTTTADRSTRTKSKSKPKESAAAISMTEVSQEEPLPKATSADTKQKKDTKKAPLSAKSIAGCETIVNRLVPPHRALFALLPPHAQTLDPSMGSSFKDLLQVAPAHCQEPALRAKALAAIKDVMTQHSSRIGLILPLTGPDAKRTAFIVAGMRAAFQEAGVNFDKAVILKDSGGQPKTAELRLAELIFKDRPSMVIGGLDLAEADILSRYAGDLLMPTVILSRDRALTGRSTYVYNVYPDEKRLAETLATAANKRGFKRFAILKPVGGKSDKVSQYFREAVVSGGGTVVEELAYIPNNFDSMQGVARQIFKTEAADRNDEFRAAYRRARQRAQEEHVPFDPRMVVLKPIINFDAVFLPDDFRMARHFSKLFQFHMVDKLPMIGNHEWRSPALIEPFDAFLEGSFFADFIGSYDKLPPSVSAPTIGSPYFVQPQSVAAVDFQLIGYRVGRTARMALKAPTTTRHSVHIALGTLTSDNPVFFGTSKVFDAERQSNWPTYLFNVSKGQLTLDASQNSTALVTAKTRP